MGNKRRRVLIVDDDTELINVMRIYFQRSGFEAETADSGQKALKLFDSFNPDAVILDILMPGMDGVKVCKAIRVDKGNLTMPIIALTGFHKEKTKEEILEAGANLYLTKPIDISKLIKHIKDLMPPDA
ncbi:MAG: response regulator [Actinobacteria bacterium]|nr:response regulator [Actinomycetota bacterium]MCG2819349.1 response regulator [Actinomycetes bacterium]MBU4218868.1 response regulator [Actinomycetota bacterium]MBU4358877.1 response regulator [Actinomycetota bacterium]MBU4392262.1 response regulator [Actinomycetota bacterium]